VRKRYEIATGAARTLSVPPAGDEREHSTSATGAHLRYGAHLQLGAIGPAISIQPQTRKMNQINFPGLPPGGSSAQ
jgi:hypothetical protein